MFDVVCPKYSNGTLLEVSLVLFSIFVISEIFGAYISNSLSLLGDAAAMSVDVATYVFNMYGEWTRNSNERLSFKMLLFVEVIIPLISILGLLVVTGYVGLDGVKMLLHPLVKDDVNVNYLYGYSVANFVIDITISSMFFFRANEVLLDYQQLPKLSLDTNIDSEDEEFGHLEDDLGYSLQLNNQVQTNPSVVCFSIYGICCSSRVRHVYTMVETKSSYENDGFIKSSYGSGGSVKKNLNMVTAFTHVIGDTIRTIAVFLAAMVSTLSGIDGDICDAWAAVFVAITLMFLCIPLLVELYSSYLKLRQQHEDESIFFRSRNESLDYHNGSNGVNGFQKPMINNSGNSIEMKSRR